MRKSKTRKTEKKAKAKSMKKQKSEIRAEEDATKEKYQEWLNLPEREWTEARKARNAASQGSPVYLSPLTDEIIKNANADPDGIIQIKTD